MIKGYEISLILLYVVTFNINEYLMKKMKPTYQLLYNISITIVTVGFMYTYYDSFYREHSINNNNNNNNNNTQNKDY